MQDVLLHEEVSLTNPDADGADAGAGADDDDCYSSVSYY